MKVPISLCFVALKKKLFCKESYFYAVFNRHLVNLDIFLYSVLPTKINSYLARALILKSKIVYLGVFCLFLIAGEMIASECYS